MASALGGVSELDREIVYAIVRSIPRGKVTTYTNVSRRAFGTKDYAELVGQLMRDCPDAEIPVHRVVPKNGQLSEHYSRGGLEVWKRQLKAEEITFIAPGLVELEKCYWNPNWESNTVAKWHEQGWEEE